MNRLKEIRQQRGLSGLGLAVKAKLSTATVTAIEKWDHVPSHLTQERIANTLNVQILDVWPELGLEATELHTREEGHDANS